MKIRFTKYLHDDYSAMENRIKLMADGLSSADAHLILDSGPWYHLGLKYEFDTETKELTFLGFETT